MGRRHRIHLTLNERFDIRNYLMNNRKKLEGKVLPAIAKEVDLTFNIGLSPAHIRGVIDAIDERAAETGDPAWRRGRKGTAGKLQMIDMERRISAIEKTLAEII